MQTQHGGNSKMEKLLMVLSRSSSWMSSSTARNCDRAPGGSYPPLPFDVSMNTPLTARDGLDSNSRSMEVETAIKTEKLVGKYFHSANENNKVEWQGVVIGEPNPGWYLVQLFEWASGKPSVQRLVPIEKMNAWLFYPDRDTMTSSSTYA